MHPVKAGFAFYDAWHAFDMSVKVAMAFGYRWGARNRAALRIRQGQFASSLKWPSSADLRRLLLRRAVDAAAACRYRVDVQLHHFAAGE